MYSHRHHANQVLAGVLTLVAGLGTAWSVAPRVPGGDEPHYLVITAEPAVRRRSPNREQPRGAATRSAYLRATPAGFLQRGRDGQIYSIHAPGVSAVVVLPGFAAAGYRGAQGTVLLLAASAARSMWSAAWRASGQRRRRVVCVGGRRWIVDVRCSRAHDFSGRAGRVRCRRRGLAAGSSGEGRRAGWHVAPSSCVSSALAALPWLHTRFAVIAAGLGAAIAWRLWTVARRVRRPIDRNSGAVLVFLAVPLASALGWFAYFRLIYGTSIRPRRTARCPKRPG